MSEQLWSSSELGINHVQCPGNTTGYRFFVATLAKRELLFEAIFLCSRDMSFDGYRAYARSSLLSKPYSTEYIIVVAGAGELICVLPADERYFVPGRFLLNENLCGALEKLELVKKPSRGIISGLSDASPSSCSAVGDTVVPAEVVYRTCFPWTQIEKNTKFGRIRAAVADDLKRRVRGGPEAANSPASTTSTKVLSPSVANPSPSVYETPRGMVLRLVRDREKPISSDGCKIQKSPTIRSESPGQELPEILERLSRAGDSHNRRSTPRNSPTSPPSSSMRLWSYVRGGEVQPRKLFKSASDCHEPPSPMELFSQQRLRHRRLQRPTTSRETIKSRRFLSKRLNPTNNHSTHSTIQTHTHNRRRLPSIRKPDPESESESDPESHFLGCFPLNSDDDHGESLGSVDSPRSVSDEECDSGLASEYSDTEPLESQSSSSQRSLPGELKRSERIKLPPKKRTAKLVCHSQESH